MSDRMRAAVLEEPGRAGVRRLASRGPGPSEARVRLQGSGVCGSDLPVWRGLPSLTYPRPPGSPGHEGWGVVERVGSEVEEVREGDRVGVLGDRAYADRCVVPARCLVPLPAALDGEPFPAEPLGCVMNVWRRSAIAAGDRVAVVGIGFLGALLVELAAGAGARVVSISRRPTALRAAEASGAEATVSLDGEEEAEEAVLGLTGGDRCDVVVEAAGVQRTLDLAARLVRVRGRLVIAGYHQDGPRRVDMQMWNWRGIDVVNAHERAADAYLGGMREAACAVAEGRLTPGPLITHRVPLERVGEALDLLAERPPGFMKAVVRS